MDDTIEILSNSEEGDLEDLSRREILTPFIQSSVAALGGFITTPKGERVYELGDSCLGCLRDLKKFWRKDDTDDDRTVARIFWETRVLSNDLVPILLETAGKGSVADKRAIACADLITAMTWPIDVAEELQELDDEQDAGADYNTLLQAQLSYKLTLLQSGALSALLAIMMPSLTRSKRDRTERDGQVINVILHAYRNLAFIKDLPVNAFKSSDRAEYSSLQSRMVVIMKDTGIFDVFSSLAANARDSMFNPYNTLLLEIYYLLLRGVKPHTLTLDPKKGSQGGLKSLLEVESKGKQLELRQGSSRHSRFGTTVAIKSNGDQYIVHRQSGITADPASVMGRTKIKAARKIKRQDELASFEYLGSEALAALRLLAVDFLESCFEAFFSSVLKDIKAERAKITEADNLRLLAVVRWFLEFFLASRSREMGEHQSTGTPYESMHWRFEMVGEVVERSWVGWVLRRMRMAMDDKPIQWTELRAGMDCLSQLLLLLEQMSLPDSPDFAHEVSKGLQHQLYYSGEILEIAFDSLRGYKEQSIAYLDSTVHLAYLLLRMLERWAKTQGEMYVRKNKKTKSKSKKGEEDVVVNVDLEDESDRPGHTMWNEHMFTFEKFESKFATEDITRACLAYLDRYREFDSPEKLKRVVGLMHRQAVKAKAEGLFFKVSTLELFNRIIDDEKTFPRDASHKDLIQLVTFILRKFFKAMEENPLLLVEAFYPKNRGQWKQFSSYEPEFKETRDRSAKIKSGTADVVVKKGYTEEQQLGIVIAVLVEQEKISLVDWLRTTLMTVIGLRLAIMSEIESFADQPGNGADAVASSEPKEHSSETMNKIEDYSLPYIKEEYAEAATKDPHLKLALRLISCHITDPDAEELEWYIPAALTPEDLQKHLDVIARYLEEPIDLDGQKPLDLLQKKRAARTRTRRIRQAASSSTEEESDDEPKKRSKKRQKEAANYKSAEFINDSDAELGDDEEFFRKEADIRARAQAAADTGVGLMLATGTRKRKRGKIAATEGTESAQPEDEPVTRSNAKTVARKRNKADASQGDPQEAGTLDGKSSPAAPPRARPKPRTRYTTSSVATNSSPPSSPQGPSSINASGDELPPAPTRNIPSDPEQSDDDIRVSLSRPPRRRAVVLSDDDDD